MPAPTPGAARRGATKDSRLVIHHSLTLKLPMSPGQGKRLTAYGGGGGCVCCRGRKRVEEMGEGPRTYRWKWGLAVPQFTTCLFCLYSWKVRLQATVIWQPLSTSQHEMTRASGILCHRRRHHHLAPRPHRRYRSYISSEYQKSFAFGCADGDGGLLLKEQNGCSLWPDTHLSHHESTNGV
jgi:hypothetical protein